MYYALYGVLLFFFCLTQVVRANKLLNNGSTNIYGIFGGLGSWYFIYLIIRIFITYSWVNALVMLVASIVNCLPLLNIRNAVTNFITHAPTRKQLQSMDPDTRNQCFQQKFFNYDVACVKLAKISLFVMVILAVAIHLVLF